MNNIPLINKSLSCVFRVKYLLAYAIQIAAYLEVILRYFIFSLH